MSTPSRPLSPHLGIYRRQYTMVLSILHRVSGLALSGALIVLTVLLLAVASGPAAYDPLAALIATPVGLALAGVFIVCFWYHFCAGIRHLVFDTGHLLERREARRSGLVLVLAVLVLSALTLLCVLRSQGLV